MKSSTHISERSGTPNIAGNFSFTNALSGALNRARNSVSRLAFIAEGGDFFRPGSLPDLTAISSVSTPAPPVVSNGIPTTTTSTVGPFVGIDTTTKHPDWDHQYDIQAEIHNTDNDSIISERSRTSSFTTPRTEADSTPTGTRTSETFVGRQALFPPTTNIDTINLSNSVDPQSVNSRIFEHVSNELVGQISHDLVDRITDRLLNRLGDSITDNRRSDNTRDTPNIDDLVRNVVQQTLTAQSTANEQTIQRLAAERSAAELTFNRLTQQRNSQHESRSISNYVPNSSVPDRSYSSLVHSNSTISTIPASVYSTARSSNSHTSISLSSQGCITSTASNNLTPRSFSNIPTYQSTHSQNPALEQAMGLLNQAISLMNHNATSTDNSQSNINPITNEIPPPVSRVVNNTYTTDNNTFSFHTALPRENHQNPNSYPRVSQDSQQHLFRDTASTNSQFTINPSPIQNDTHNHSSVANTLLELTSVLTQRPNIENEKFTGDIKKYDSFKIKFKTLMSSGSLSLEEQARILYQSLSGEVISQLDYVPNLNSPQAYDQLWESLDTEYGRYQNGAASYVTELISKLQQLPICRTSNDFQALYKLIKYHYTALEQLDQVTEAEHISIRMLILGKLTGKQSATFNNLIDRCPNTPIIKTFLDILKSEIRLMGRDELAKGASRLSKNQSKSNLVDAQEQRGILVNNVDTRRSRQEDRSVGFQEPPRQRYSPSSPRNYRNQQSQFQSPSRFDDRNRFQNYSSANRDTRPSNANRFQNHSSPNRDTRPSNANRFQNHPSPNRNTMSSNANPQNSFSPRRPDSNLEELQQRFTRRCFFCLSNSHDSDNCQEFQDPNEYKDILYKFRLCFNCHHQGHPNVHCIMPKRCTRGCEDNSKHSSVVCSFRPS